MKNAIILHGIEDTREDFLTLPVSSSNLHWYPWIQRELIRHNILAQTPEMPNPYIPDMNYDEWVRVFEQFDVNENTLLIGHSCGGGFLLKYLSLNPQIKIGQLVLVAPWLDLEGEHATFFQNLELSADLPKRIKKIDLFCSSDDMDCITKSVDKIKSVYGNKISYHEFTDKGHFVKGTVGKEFPELWDIIK